MKVPFHLRKLPERAPTAALLVTSPAAADILEVCTRLGAGPLPRVFRVAGGFLLQLERPVAEWLPWTIRLRRLSGNLFVPADADLVPSLLDDEKEALGRARGLVLLPGGKTLGFAPDEPLTLATLVAGADIERRPWEPLPTPLALADRVREISLELPVPPPEQILGGEGQDIGIEEPRPESSSTPATVAGQVGMGLGRTLVSLGNFLGMKGLAGMGAGMIRRALERAPRLSEGLLGRQEAALRALLRKFREGNVDEALKRALPLSELGGRGGTVHAEPRLPVHDLVYSLNTLLARESGPAGIFLGGLDVQRELEREYRKAAVQAAMRGDYRRAAYIYGKLLKDFRMAANTLAQGGLHHDAAILYLTKLQDTYAAARAFEAAGEIDRAVKLYRQRGDHVLAGDLLDRAGEEEAALAEYLLAADKLAASGGHLAAGDLLLARARRPDLAQGYFEAGWMHRPDPNALPCALRLTRMLADQGATERLLTLVAEADAYLEPPGMESEANQFYNEVARLANRNDLASVRPELRDRALLGLATKLRQRAAVEIRPGSLISTLFGRGHPWPSALVSDAHYALKGALRSAAPATSVSPAPFTVIRTRLGADTVTAAGTAPDSGDVFLGFQSGAVVCFRPLTSELVRLPVSPGPVVSLAVDMAGQFLVVLQANEGVPGNLTSYTQNPDGTFETREKRATDWRDSWLTALVLKDADYLLGVWGNNHLRFLRTPSLLPCDDCLVPWEMAHALLIPGSAQQQKDLILLLRTQHSQWYLSILNLVPTSRDGSERIYLGWGPDKPRECSLRAAPLSWGLREPGVLELAGLDEDGTIHWSILNWALYSDDQPIATISVNGPGYLAATIVRPGLLAGVRKNQVDWLRRQSSGIHPKGQTAVSFSSPVACFPSHPTNELMVVNADGSIIRVPVPG